MVRSTERGHTFCGFSSQLMVKPKTAFARRRSHPRLAQVASRSLRAGVLGVSEVLTINPAVISTSEESAGNPRMIST